MPMVVGIGTMTERYLRIKIKNAKNEAERYEKRIADLRIELARYVDLYVISVNEAAYLEVLLKDINHGCAIDT